MYPLDTQGTMQLDTCIITEARVVGNYHIFFRLKSIGTFELHTHGMMFPCAVSKISSLIDTMRSLREL